MVCVGLDPVLEYPSTSKSGKLLRLSAALPTSARRSALARAQ
jgi:hypothetical protein